eukprot:ANDGO_02106.mRNA.1 Protein LTV1 homolog
MPRYFDKKQARKYRLVFRGGDDVLSPADGSAAPVLQEVDRKGRKKISDTGSIVSFADMDGASVATSRREIVELGLPDDGYDYSQHLRTISSTSGGVYINAEYTEDELNELSTRIRVNRRVLDARRVRVSSICDEEDVADEDMEDDMVEDLDAEMGDAEIDHVLAAEDEAFEELEDDFVLKASGGAGGDDADMPIPARPVRFVGMRRRKVPPTKGAGVFGDSKHDEDEDEDDVDYEGEEEEDGEEDDEEEYDEEGQYDDAEDASANWGHVYGSVKQARRVHNLEEQFEKMLSQYDDDELGELEEDDETLQGAVEASHYKTVFEEYLRLENVKEPWIKLHVDEMVKPITSEMSESEIKAIVDESKLLKKQRILAFADVHAAEDEASGNSTQVIVEKKRNDWDCETIISTYSNLENHPGMIKEERKKIKLSQKTGIPLGYLHSKKQTAVEDESSASDDPSVDEAKNIGKARSANESAEEKRERKKLLKEEKRQQRERKKNLKETFTREEDRQKRQITSNPRIRQVPL